MSLVQPNKTLKAETSTASGYEPQVRDLMTTEVFTLNQDDNLIHLDELMKWKRIRHVPVLNEDSELVGIVTHRDFLRVAISRLAEMDRGELKSLYKEIPILRIMNRNIMVARPDMPLAQAARIMRKHKYGCLPVVDEDFKLAGLITEADFVRSFEEWDVTFK